MDTNISQYLVDASDATEEHGPWWAYRFPNGRTATVITTHSEETGLAFAVQSDNGPWHWDLTSDNAVTVVEQIAAA